MGFSLAWVEELRRVLGKCLVVVTAPLRATLNLTIGGLLVDCVGPVLEPYRLVWLLEVMFYLPILVLEFIVLVLHSHLFVGVIAERMRPQAVSLRTKLKG